MSAYEFPPELVERIVDVMCKNWDVDVRTQVRNVLRESGHAELVAALQGMVHEWNKLTRYGSPMAKAANENLQLARAALGRAGYPEKAGT